MYINAVRRKRVCVCMARQSAVVVHGGCYVRFGVFFDHMPHQRVWSLHTHVSSLSCVRVCAFPYVLW